MEPSREQSSFCPHSAHAQDARGRLQAFYIRQPSWWKIQGEPIKLYLLLLHQYLRQLIRRRLKDF